MINKKLLDKIIIGTAQFGLDYGIANSSGKMDLFEIQKIINFARKNNIKNIDTAHAYGDCEERLGKVGINNFDVIVKLPATIPTFPYDRWVKKSLNSSFKKMNINKADTVLIHNVKYLFEKKRGKIIYSELLKFKKEKKINNIGVSLYSIQDLKKVIKMYDIDVVLMSLNIFDQRIINNKIIKTLKNKKIKIYTRSTFLQGLLLLSKNQIPSKFRKWENKLENWFRLIKKSKTSAYDHCLNFVLNNKNIDKTLIGIDNFNQFKDIFKFRKKLNLNYKNLNCNRINRLINPAKW